MAADQECQRIVPGSQQFGKKWRIPLAVLVAVEINKFQSRVARTHSMVKTSRLTAHLNWKKTFSIC